MYIILKSIFSATISVYFRHILQIHAAMVHSFYMSR